MGGTRITIVNFDVPALKARISIQHQVAKPNVSGPSSAFGGVEVDGGGVILVGNTVVRIPPRSPLLEILSRLTLLSQPEEGLEPQTRRIVSGAVFKDIEQLAKKAQRQ